MRISVRTKVFAGTKKQKFIAPEKDDGVFEVYVREPAQKNLANTRVRELIAEHFDIQLVNVQILTGFHSRNKLLEVKIEE